MFTGLVEEIGKLLRKDQINGGFRLKLSAKQILDDLKIDDSVSVNGVCLTAVSVSEDSFLVEAVGETLNKTSIKNLLIGSEVNLERAVRLSDRLGGHLVQGHVNGVGKITAINKLGENYFLEFSIPEDLRKYVIDEGSIAVEGISLTIAKLEGLKIGINVIPHTWKSTILRNKSVGDEVNIETDVIAKYIENFIVLNKENNGNKFSDEWFKNLGYE